MSNSNNTSWQPVADWYKKVPNADGGYHKTLIIPGVNRMLSQYLSKGATVLDLACGEGTVSQGLFKQGYQVTGIDLAPDLITAAKKQYPKITFLVENAEELSPEFLKKYQGQFNAVVSVLALQNISSLYAVFKNISGLLTDNGIFLFVINHPAFRIPKASSWGWLGKDVQYRIVEKYMSELKKPITAHPGEQDSAVTWSFHRPLQQYFKAMHANKLTTLELEEWVSPKMSEPGQRAFAENRARNEFPLFMTIVAKKI
jgi:2-polyprenyl-3-methyl-5-hydroxy-6-metoxy-1,4-benzoquinol methylase